MSKSGKSQSSQDEERYEEQQKFIAQRITTLRTALGVSEYKMSYELGHNKNYIRSITVGGSMPSLRGLLGICEYFNMTPAQFFDEEFRPIMSVATARMKKVDDKDIQMLIDILDHFRLDK